MVDRHLERLGQKLDDRIRKIGILSTNVMLINCYDNKGLTKEEAELVLCSDEYIFCYHEFQRNKMSNVYEPFLDWIKEAYEKYVDISFDDFMEVCDVYMQHRPIFKSYFETGIGRRNEILFVDAIEYEIERMHAAIVSMLSYISKQKPIVFMLNKLQFSGSSTMELLNCFFESAGIERIVIFATINIESAVFNKKKKVWKQLIDNFSGIKSIYDWDKFINEQIIAEWEQNEQYYELSEVYINERIRSIRNMRAFLALSQADYNLQNLYYKCEVEKMDISQESKFEIYKMYIQTSAETQHIAEGFEVKNALQKLIDNEEKNFDFHVLQAYLETINGQFEEARKTVCAARCLVGENQRRQDTLEIIDYIARMWYWKKPWQDSALKEDELFIIDICKRLDYKDLLARIYITGFENDHTLYDRVEGLEERLVYFNKGYELAEQMGNYGLQLVGCYKPLMIASTFGYTEVVNYFYKEKCIPLARKCRRMKEEAHAYTGLGYNSMGAEEFDTANAYFNKALIIHYRFDDIEAMMEALYNMTMNAIMVEDYQSADSYVGACIYAVENMRRDGRIGILHVSKLYGYKALCSYFLDDQYMSKIYLRTEKRMLDYVLESEEDIKNFGLWYDELFIYYYVKGLIYKNGELYENAKECLEQALLYSEKAEGLKYFTYTRCLVELARIYMVFEEKCKAIGCFEKAIAYAKESGLKKQELKMLLFLREVTGEDRITEEDEEAFMETKLIWEKSALEHALSGITITDVRERIKNIGVYNRSKEEQERIEFLSRWSKMINKTTLSIEDMVSRVLRAFCDNFQIENLLFVDIKNGKPSAMYEKLNVQLDDTQLEFIYEYAKRNPNEFSASRMDEFFYDHKEIMALFDMSKISSFMYIPIVERDEVKYIVIMYMTTQNIWGTNINMFMLNNDLLFLFSSSLHQLSDAIERERIHAELRSMNDKLSYVALVDNLTGLYNRQGLQHNLDKMLAKQDMLTAVLYVDLDNFKYYNDTFGHEIGDLVLVSFADIVKKVCGERGFAVRYGGDEFLIIMNLEWREEVLELAAGIFDSLAKEASFIPLVEQSLGKSIKISDDKRVSCSVGISFLDKQNGDKAFDIALKQADDALYYIKRTGKHRYEIWRLEMM